MTMTLNSFSDILDRHGSEPDNWPLQDRAACLALIADSTEARQLLQEHEQFEHTLDHLAVPEFPGLQARVLSQALPPRARSAVDKVLDWLLPPDLLGPHFWRPALAACLPLVFGILVGNYFSFGVITETQGFEYWDDELYMLSLNDYTENLLQ